MEKLIEELRRLIDSPMGDLDNLQSVYPFNKFEYTICHLLGTGKISLNQYLDIRNRYLERNKNLYVFGITAPRTFGETWAQRHLNELVPELQKPSTDLDKNYSRQYDFWYNGIRIEVKASRAVRRESGGTLIEKALASDSPYGFDMNFQQLKPACCDVFVWIGIWLDVIRYWVLSSAEVKSKFKEEGRQHRGNIGEGQIWIKETNIDNFAKYEVKAHELLSKIVEKGS